MKITSLCLVIFSLLCQPGCANAPTDTAKQALRAWCNGNSKDFTNLMTPDSANLYKGLATLDPDRFKCPGPLSAVTITDTGVRKENLRILNISGQDTHFELALVRRDGKWLVDLFYTEESLFFTTDDMPDEIPDSSLVPAGEMP